MYTQVTFTVDNLAQIEEHAEGKLLRRRTMRGTAALVWMIKQGKVWEWFKNDDGEEVAVWEKEELV